MSSTVHTQEYFVDLTSSIEESSKTQACPNEHVVYTCKTSGARPLLTWFVEPNIEIGFFASDNVDDFQMIENVQATLITRTENFLQSNLIIAPTNGGFSNTTVMCSTNGGVSSSKQHIVSGINFFSIYDND